MSSCYIYCDHINIHTGENEDYTKESHMLTFTPTTAANLSVQACIYIHITDDDVGEPLETFKVQVQSPDSRVSVNGDRITVAILDNESKLSNNR